MDIIKYVIIAFVLIVSLIQIINPRILWKASRWQFKNPEANEPSKAGFMVQRVVGVIVFIAAIGIAISFVTMNK